MIKEFTVDKLTVKKASSRLLMGKTAGDDIANKMIELLGEKNDINVIFAAAPSQNEMLARLVSRNDVEWNRVRAFHMDEYIGLEKDAPQGFGNFLKEHIFDKLPFKSVDYLNGQTTDVEAECARYSKLLREFPVDIVCLGIGENGHIAFNDPAFAQFSDNKLVKRVELDNICRNQQVNDGCFKNISEVPTHALTLTIPALTKGKYMFCTVPAKTKAHAVSEMIYGAVTEKCPASILRTHDNAIMYIDPDSASEL